MSKGDWETAGAPNGRTAAGRLDWVDAVKGLTIILVVLHHAVAGFRFDPNLPVWVADLTRALDPVRMPLFFLVAGLFAKKALDGPADAFIRGKVVYFLYFYVLWSLIIFLFRFSLNPITNSVTYWWEIFLILWDPLPTIWFLYALMLSFVILRLLRSVPPVYIVGVAAIIQAQFLLGVWPEGVVIADKLAKLFVYFVIGVYASEWIRSCASNARPLVVALCAAGFGVLAVLAASWDLQKIPSSVLLAVRTVCCGNHRSYCSCIERGPRPLAGRGRQLQPVHLSDAFPAGCRDSDCPHEDCRRDRASVSHPYLRHRGGGVWNRVLSDFDGHAFRVADPTAQMAV